MYKSDCASFFPTVKMSRLFWTFVKLLSRQISSMNLSHINLKNYPNKWGHQVILLLAIIQNTARNMKSWQIWKENCSSATAQIFSFFFFLFFKQEDFQFIWVLKIFPSRVVLLLHNNLGFLWALISCIKHRCREE